MKLLCKLFGHKWEPVPFTMSEDRCERCGQILKHNAGCFIYNFNRSDLDESENVTIDEDVVNDLWDRCLKYNSYTHMGSEVRFDKIADMVIGENQWHMRDQALFILMMLLDFLKIKSNNKLEKIKEEIYELETDIMRKTLEQNKILVKFINESRCSHDKWLDKHMD